MCTVFDGAFRAKIQECEIAKAEIRRCEGKGAKMPRRKCEGEGLSDTNTPFWMHSVTFDRLHTI